VVHGIGKPRFVLPTEELFGLIGTSKTVASANTTTVVITSVVAGQLTQLDETIILKVGKKVLKNRRIICYQ
jgi:hypothetical protein